MGGWQARKQGVQDLATGEWTTDSGKIVDLLESKFPQPELGTVEASPQV
mgnify:CR=1 FL=1